jgi:hypothetical protein
MYFYIPAFAFEPSFTGFWGVLRDANMPVPDAQHPPADPDIDRGDPCPEDEELFDRPDAATMEEAISRFMDGMEAQERGGFNDLHGLLGRLPVPTVKPSQAMSHDFLPSMTEEEQKRLTPSKLLLYKHALEYRYKLIWL